MVVGRAAFVIKRNLLIRLQRRVKGCYYAPNDKGFLCPFALESGSYMPVRETFEPVRRMISSKGYYSADGKVG